MHAPCPRGQRAKARGKEDGDGRRGGARFPGTADGDGIEDEAKKIGTKALLQMCCVVCTQPHRAHIPNARNPKATHRLPAWIYSGQSSRTTKHEAPELKEPNPDGGISRSRSA